MQNTNLPSQVTYQNAYSWYKFLELATPFVELTLTVGLLGYLKLYQRQQSQPGFVHRILKILLVADLLIALVLAWQALDTNLHFGKAWIFYHTEALMLMGGAQFGRHLAYWLYCYELLKVGKLMPQIINRDFSSGKDPMLNFQKKKTR